jgi:hypothetical protein
MKTLKQRVFDATDVCNGVTAAPIYFPLCCARCKDSFDCAGISLVKKSKWIAIKCRGCRVTSKANLWLCSCELPWPTCPSHREAGFQCKRPLAKKCQPKPCLQPSPGQLGDPPPPPNRCPPCFVPLKQRSKHAESSTCIAYKRARVQASVPPPPLLIPRPGVKRTLAFTPGPKLMLKLQKLQTD